MGGLRRGNRVVCLCLWHEDTNPSCTIAEGERGLYFHCFGCGRSGDIFELAAAKLGKTTRGHDFIEVVEYLDRLELPAGLPKQSPPPQAKHVHSGNPLAFAVIAECVADLCPIAQQQDVVDYLGKRRLLDEAILAGWSALPCDEDAQNKVIDEVIGTVGQKEWLKSGLALSDGGLSFPDHRLIIPWCDPLGHAGNLQRRLVHDMPDVPNYVFPKDRPLPWPYGVEHLLAADKDAELMFVEGAFDTLAVGAMLREAEQGRLVLGLPGVSGWRRDWRFLCVGRRVVIAFDADRAGATARDSVAADVRGIATEVRGSRPPSPFKDWAELRQSEGGA